MSPAQERLRNSFIAYLDNPSSANKRELKEASNDIYAFAASAAAQNEFADVDDLNTEVTRLTNEAIKDIYISQKKLDSLRRTLDNLPKDEIRFATVLNDIAGTLEGIGDEDEQLKSRVVSDQHYKAFAAVYSIQADGQRIQKVDAQAGKAAIELSNTLLTITSRIQEKNKLEQSDSKEISEAYMNAKGQGIENHRGSEIKNKFHNFCRALSCIFIVPIALYVKQGSLWAKTKTQSDVDSSEEALNKYQESFKKQ